MIYEAAIVLQPVGYHQVLHLQGHVIAGGLVEGILRYFHLGALAFHHHHGFAVSVVHHNIGSLGHFVVLQAGLHGH